MKKLILKISLFFIAIILLFILSIYLLSFKKTNINHFPYIFTIEKGQDIKSIANNLYNENIITNKFVFNMYIQFLNKENKIKNGEYTFKKNINIRDLIKRFETGDYDYNVVKLIIKEGESSKDIANKIFQNFPKLNSSSTDISEKLKSLEGKLFPETYYFSPFVTFEEILKSIDREYNKRIKKFEIDIASSTYNINQILTIASILEKEVPKNIDMKKVSGIIKNRLNIDMPLQMDSTLGYITGKASLDLSYDDLMIISNYNTYKIKGLPIGPIGNPGENAIEAALNPEKHDYLYFLSDKEGNNHYSKTYKEHLNFKRKYIDVYKK